eukprot:m.30237 g.30237  ORF g.30237 m.30237 type:complete len:394 (+) comp31322_c0_seq7:41-1222(+)
MEDTDELREFRMQWQEELQEVDEGSSQLADSSEQEKSAFDLYLRGTECERQGLHYDALHYYRQAVQLDPYIESKISSGTSTELQQMSDQGIGNDSALPHPQYRPGELSGVCIEFEGRLTLGQSLLSCQRMRPQAMTHVSALPQELLFYIFKWVVSGDLDMRSLEQLSMVCKSFYICALDPELWRLACYKLWGPSCECQPGLGKSWRQMYISQPHLLFDGIYISHSSYVRRGEPSLDQFYRPYHTVEYFRYLRFFSDGRLLYLNSPEAPSLCVPRFKSLVTAVGFQKGCYKLSGDNLFLEISPPPNVESGLKYGKDPGQPYVATTERSFHIVLQIKNSGKRRCTKLVWASYSCHSVEKSTGTSNVSEFFLDDQYSPFCFSRVKSFSMESTRILQ